MAALVLVVARRAEFATCAVACRCEELFGAFLPLLGDESAAAVVALILEAQSRLQAQILLFGDEFAGVEFGKHLHLLLEEFAGALLEILVSQLLHLLLVLLLSCEALAVVLLLQRRGGFLVVVDAPPLFEVFGAAFEVLECEAVVLLLVLLGGDEPLGLFVLERLDFGLVALVDVCE